MTTNTDCHGCEEDFAPSKYGELRLYNIGSLKLCQECLHTYLTFEEPNWFKYYEPEELWNYDEPSMIKAKEQYFQNGGD